MSTAFIPKFPAAFVNGRGLLFRGELVSTVNVAVLLFYDSLPDSATICVAPKECVNASAIL